MEAKYRKTRQCRSLAGLFTLTILFVLTSIPSPASEWHTVGPSREFNISGLALVKGRAEQIVFLVVHDNKKKNEKRAGIIRIDDGRSPIYTPLEWPDGKLPVDLEAVTAVVGKPNNFLALTSAGTVYHLELNDAANGLSVIKTFPVPSIPVNANFEGVAFQKVGDKNLIVWADRGEDVKPGTLFWSKLDLDSYTFGETESAFIKVPYPNSNVRHISDLKVDRDGKIFISSAADPGNDGPFASAVYLAGNMVLENPSRIVWRQSAELSQVFSIADRKIEAFEIIPGEKVELAFGTDDENLGAAIYFNQSKGAVGAAVNFSDDN